MNRTEAETFLGTKVYGREITEVRVSGGCTDRRMYLVDASGERVANVTNMSTADLKDHSRRLTGSGSGKGPRHCK